MKKINLVLVCLTTIMVFSCKNQKKEPVEDIVEEYTVDRLPNMSDEHFAQALDNMDGEDDNVAAKHLKMGIEELKKEGKEVTGFYKINLDKAMAQLKKMESNLESGKKISLESLREAITNAEINVAHDYLSTNEIYVLDNPEQAASHKTRKNFNSTLANLKKEEGKMEKESKKAGEALLKEGKKLEEEYKAWEKKADEYAKKTQEHFKGYYPDYYYPYWIF